MTERTTSAANNTRQNLIDAFWMLYTQKKIEKITVKEVCALAGYNRTTFYAYFKDIYDILEEIEKLTITAEEFYETILVQVFSGAGEKDILRGAIELYHNNQKYLPILLSEHGDYTFREKLIVRILPKIKERFPDILPKELQRLTYLMEYQSYAVLGTISKWFKNGQDIPMDEFLEILIGLTTNGVRNELLSYFKIDNTDKKVSNRS